MSTAVVGSIQSIEFITSLIKIWRVMGESPIGFTNGCFDLLHYGHIRSLQEARDQCRRLVVAVNSDRAIKLIKGDSRPIICEYERAYCLLSLSCIDAVMLMDDATPHRLLNLLKPDILFKGGDYEPEQVVGREVVHGYGGQIINTSVVPQISTSKIIARIRK